MIIRRVFIKKLALFTYINCIFLILGGHCVQAEILNFAFFNPDNEAEDPATAVSAMKPWGDYIGEDIGMEVKIHYLLRQKDLETVFKK